MCGMPVFCDALYRWTHSRACCFLVVSEEPQIASPRRTTRPSLGVASRMRWFRLLQWLWVREGKGNCLWIEHAVSCFIAKIPVIVLLIAHAYMCRLMWVGRVFVFPKRTFLFSDLVTRLTGWCGKFCRATFVQWWSSCQRYRRYDLWEIVQGDTKDKWDSDMKCYVYIANTAVWFSNSGKLPNIHLEIGTRSNALKMNGCVQIARLMPFIMMTIKARRTTSKLKVHTRIIAKWSTKQLLIKSPPVSSIEGSDLAKKNVAKVTENGECPGTKKGDGGNHLRKNRKQMTEHTFSGLISPISVVF